MSTDAMYGVLKHLDFIIERKVHTIKRVSSNHYIFYVYMTYLCFLLDRIST